MAQAKRYGVELLSAVSVTAVAQNIIRWSWVMHAGYIARYTAAMADPSNAHLRFIRLRSIAEIAGFFASLERAR